MSEFLFRKVQIYKRIFPYNCSYKCHKYTKLTFIHVFFCVGGKLLVSSNCYPLFEGKVCPGEATREVVSWVISLFFSSPFMSEKIARKFPTAVPNS